MSDRKSVWDLADEEVAFWRSFIAWWEAKEDRPATLRMRQALARAERRRQALENGSHAPILKRRVHH